MKNRVFEIKEKAALITKKKLEEAVPPTPAVPAAPAPAAPAPAAPAAPAPQKNLNATAQRLNRSYQNSAAVQKASAQVNTATKFPQAFKTWFQTLGYKPDNPSITIMRVRTEVEKAMKELGFK